jgi:hypothetical protein
MKDPFDLILWALGIGVAWIVLISLTGLDDWLKGLIGKKRTNEELEAKIAALERRVAELEKKP